MSSSPSRHSSSRHSTVLSPRVSASSGNKTSPPRPPNTTDHQQLVPFESPHSGITQDMSSITLAPSISSKPASTTSSVKEGGAVEAGRRIRTPTRVAKISEADTRSSDLNNKRMTILIKEYEKTLDAPTAEHDSVSGLKTRPLSVHSYTLPDDASHPRTSTANSWELVNHRISAEIMEMTSQGKSPGGLPMIRARLMSLARSVLSRATLRNISPIITSANRVPTVKDALESVDDRRHLRATFNFSASTLDKALDPFIKSPTRLSRPSDPDTALAHATSQKLSLVDTPSDLGSGSHTQEHPKLSSQASEARSTSPLHAPSRRSVSRSSVRSSSTTKRPSNRASDDNSSVRSSRSSVFTQAGSSHTKYYQIIGSESSGSSTTRRPSIGDLNISDRPTSQSTLSQNTITSLEPKSISDQSAHASGRHRTAMEWYSSGSSCISSRFELDFDSTGDSGTYVPRPRVRQARPPVPSFLLTGANDESDFCGTPSSHNELRLIDVSAPQYHGIPSEGSIYAGSRVGNDLVFDYDNKELFAATAPALIRFLATPEFLPFSRLDYLDTWLTFFRSITTPERFFSLLMDCYGSHEIAEDMPYNLSGHCALEWVMDRILIRSEVIGILRLWVKEYWITSEDAGVLKSIEDFIEKVDRDEELAEKYKNENKDFQTFEFAQNDENVFIAQPTKDIREYLGGSSRRLPARLEQSMQAGEQWQEQHKYTTITSPLYISEANMDEISIATFVHRHRGAKEFARALTVIESDFFHSFPLDKIICLRETDYLVEQLEWERFSGALFCWVFSLLANPEDDTLYRVQTFQFFVGVAWECKNVWNHNSASVLLSVLNSATLDHLRKSSDTGHRRMLSELDDYYAMPSYVKYGFEVIKDRRPGIPIFALVIRDIQQAEEYFAKYNGVTVKDNSTGEAEPMVEIGRYTYYRRIYRALEQCYARHTFVDKGRNESIIRWICEKCQPFAASVKELHQARASRRRQRLQA